MSRSAIFLYAILISGFYCDVVELDDKCPSEWPDWTPNRLIGFRQDNNSCLTFLEIDWDDYENHISSHENSTPGYLNYVACSRLPDGWLYSHHKPQQLMGSWSQFISWDNVLLGYFLISSQLNETKHRAVIDQATWTTKFMKFSSYGTEIYPETIEMRYEKLKFSSLLKGSSVPDYLSHDLNEANDYYTRFNVTGEQCPTYEIKASKVKFTPIWNSCSHMRMTRMEVHFSCSHRPYKSCQYEDVMGCHLDPQTNSWYDRMRVIKQQEEKPWGQPCPNVTVDKYASPCNVTCHGEWGEWLGPEEECGTFTRYRYAPLKKADRPCYKASIICCAQSQTIVSGRNCSSIAQGTDMNLWILGCENGGTLIALPNGKSKCICGDEYTGGRCETVACKPNYCQNGGNCIGKAGLPVCICKADYKGDRCEIEKMSCGILGKCANGGTCVVVENGRAYCKCTPQYVGNTCKDKAEYCTAQTCNLRGSCTNDTERHTFKCHCYPGHSGRRCETKAELASTQNFSQVALVVLITLAIVAFISGATVYTRHRREHGRHRERGSTSEAPQSSHQSTQSKKPPENKVLTMKTEAKKSKPLS